MNPVLLLAPIVLVSLPVLLFGPTLLGLLARGRDSTERYQRRRRPVQ